MKPNSTLQRATNYIRQIPKFWFGEGIRGLHSFSRRIAGNKQVQLRHFLPPNHSHAFLELNCDGLNARTVRKLLRRAIRLDQIDNSRIHGAFDVFSKRNIIHQILSIEAEVFTPQEMAIVYDRLGEILLKVKRCLTTSMTPEEKLKLVYRIMGENGFKPIENWSMLTAHVLGKTANCMPSSFIVLAVAQELGWPVRLVSASKHLFVRWEEKDAKINIDGGEIRKDQFYIKEFSWNGSCLDLDGIIALSYNNRGITKSSLGRLEEAIQDYDEAIRLNPKYAGAYYNRGIAKSNLRKREEAIQDYDEAIRLNPKFVEAYYNRGFSKFFIRRHEEAIQDYDEAIRLDPENAETYLNCGIAKSMFGRLEEAIQDYNEAIRLDPENAEAYQKRGAAKSGLGKYEEAIRDYDEAIRLKPEFAIFYFTRGFVKFRFGKHEEAIRDFNEAIRLDPEYKPAYKNRKLAISKLERSNVLPLG